MFSKGSKAIVLCFAFILAAPLLYAQNDPILFKVTPLPEKDSIKDAIPYTLTVFPEKELINVIVPIIPVFNEASIKIIPLTEPALLSRAPINLFDYNNMFLATALIPQLQSKNGMFNIAVPKSPKTRGFLDFVEKKIDERNAVINDEKKRIRQEWEFFFGMDVWYPYFKVKEVEDWVCDRANVELFDFKGRLKFERNQISYSFKRKF